MSHSEPPECPECRCGLPLLRVNDTFWACAECDQGTQGGHVLAAPWFLSWQEQRQAEVDGREG